MGGVVLYLVLLIYLTTLGPNAEASHKRRVILVSFDGFRFDYIDKAGAQMRNISAFEELIHRGFRGKVISIMPTITFPTHFATATGRNAEDHGIMNNVFYDEGLDAQFSYKVRRDSRDPRWWGYNGNEPIWITNERHNGRKSGVLFWPGSASPYKGKLPTKTELVFNSSFGFRRQIEQVVRWMKEDEDMTLGATYIHEPDSTGHREGPDSDKIMDKLEELNGVVAHLLSSIKATPSLNESVNVILTADHGMEAVDPDRIIKVYEAVDVSEYIVNPSQIFVGIWPKSDGPTIEQLYEKLVEANFTGLNVYLKENLPERFYYKNTPRCPPLILLADPGYTVHLSPHDWTRKGDHGYDNTNPHMFGSFVAAGPNLKSIATTQDIRQIDIYALICAILGLDEPNRVDSDIRRVVELIEPTPSETFIQKFEAFARMTPATGDVSAAGTATASIGLLLGALLFIVFRA